MANKSVYVCTDCEQAFSGDLKPKMRGSAWVEFGLLLLFPIGFVLAFLYWMWRRSGPKLLLCPECNGKLIPANSPKGKMLMVKV